MSEPWSFVIIALCAVVGYAVIATHSKDAPPADDGLNIGKLEFGLLFWSWLDVFFACLAFGISTFVSLIVATYVACTLRELWLRRGILINWHVVTGLALCATVLFFIADPFEIDHYFSAYDYYIEKIFISQPMMHALLPLLGAALLGLIGERARIVFEYRYKNILLAAATILFAPVGFFVIDEAIIESITGGLNAVSILGSGFIGLQIWIVLWIAYHFIFARKRGTAAKVFKTEDLDKILAESVCLLEQLDHFRASGDYIKIRRHLDLAAHRLRDLKDHFLLKSQIWENVGKLDLAINDFASALWYFTASLEAYSAIPNNDEIRRLTLLENIGVLSLYLGDWDAATETLQKVEQEKRQQLGPNHPDLAIAFVHLGTLFQKRRQFQKAGQYFEEALAIQSKSLPKDHIEIATTLRHLGALAYDENQPTKALEHFKAALAIERRKLSERHPDIAITLIGLSRAQSLSADHVEAEASLAEALTIAVLDQGVGVRDAVYHELSVQSAGLKQAVVAIFFGKQAVNAIQQQRGRLTSLNTELQRSFLATKEEAYQDLSTLLVEAGRLGEAQQVLAMLKEEELFDLLRRDTADDPRLTFAQLTTLEAAWQSHGDAVGQDLVRLTAEIAALEQKDALNPGEETRLGAARHELDLAARAFHAWLTELSAGLTESTDRQAHSAAINLDQLETLQGVLDDLGSNVALVSYIVGKEKLSIILTTVAFQVSRDVAVTEKVINKLVLEFREAIAQCAENDTRTFGKVLWRHLIGPIAPILHEAGIKTLMIAPYGTLRYVPFAALHDGEAYVIERFALSFVTLAAFTNLRDRPNDQWSVAGLGVSRAVPNYRPLTAVPEELHGIVRAKAEGTGVYPGIVHLDEAFTEGSFASSLKAHQVVHVASHFKLNPAQGLRSHLLLGDGKELTLERMNDASFNFRKIELMTLSACETAVGGAKQNGSEFEGFGALVQKRGAKAVVASLWPVEDGGTALLMQLFYKGKHEGLSKAAALQKAQITFLTTPKPQPYYWAAFILMGNWL